MTKLRIKPQPSMGRNGLKITKDSFNIIHEMFDEAGSQTIVNVNNIQDKFVDAGSDLICWIAPVISCGLVWRIVNLVVLATSDLRV